MAPLEAALSGVTETYFPKAPLGNFVELIWRYDGLVQAHDLERVLPTGTMSIIINLADDTSRKYDPQDPRRVETHPGAIISGPHSGCFVIDTAQQASVFGVAFTPGGAAPFLDMPASEVRDLHVSLEDIWGSDARGLREHLLEAEQEECFSRLEAWPHQTAAPRSQPPSGRHVCPHRVQRRPPHTDRFGRHRSARPLLAPLHRGVRR